MVNKNGLAADQKGGKFTNGSGKNRSRGIFKRTSIVGEGSTAGPFMQSGIGRPPAVNNHGLRLR